MRIVGVVNPCVPIERKDDKKRVRSELESW